MKLFNYIATSAILLAATGCQKESAPELEKPQVRLETAVNNYTRAKGLDFETGDHFGLYLIAYDGVTAPEFGKDRFRDNLMCTKTNTGIEHPRVYYPKTGKLDFYAYYPYSVAGVSLDDPQWLPHSVKANQNELLNYSNSDLLTAKTSGVAPTAEAVSLAFTHRMSLVNVQLLPGGTMTAQSLKNARMTTSPLASNCRVNIATGAVSDVSGSQSVIPYGNQVSIVDDKATLMSFIAIPQTIPAGTELFDIAIGTKHYIYVTDKAITLETGYKYLMEITLQPAQSKACIMVSPR